MKQIFIVEDDAGIRELLELLLISEEFNVRTFATAGKFKKVIASEHPDLILMDIMLPDGNGLDMCRDLGAEEETKEIPVVLMSAHADKNISRDTCAKDFIAKPFEIKDLLVCINKQLQ